MEDSAISYGIRSAVIQTCAGSEVQMVLNVGQPKCKEGYGDGCPINSVLVVRWAVLGGAGSTEDARSSQSVGGGGLAL